MCLPCFINTIYIHTHFLGVEMTNHFISNFSLTGSPHVIIAFKRINREGNEHWLNKMAVNLGLANVRGGGVSVRGRKQKQEKK